MCNVSRYILLNNEIIKNENQIKLNNMDEEIQVKIILDRESFYFGAFLSVFILLMIFLSFYLLFFTTVHIFEVYFFCFVIFGLFLFLFSVFISCCNYHQRFSVPLSFLLSKNIDCSTTEELKSKTLKKIHSANNDIKSLEAEIIKNNELITENELSSFIKNNKDINENDLLQLEKITEVVFNKNKINKENRIKLLNKKINSIHELKDDVYSMYNY